MHCYPMGSAECSVTCESSFLHVGSLCFPACVQIVLTLQTARFLVRLAQAAATGKAAANSGMGAYLFEDVYVFLGLQGCRVRAVWACVGGPYVGVFFCGRVLD